MFDLKGKLTGGFQPYSIKFVCPGLLLCQPKKICFHLCPGPGGDHSDMVTSIVYTDEGGKEQKMVGKIVYQTDDRGQSNIIIQVKNY